MASLTIEDYEKLLHELEAVSGDMGIYPRAVHGLGAERDYEQRDGYKNGWNACVIEYGAAIRAVVHQAGQPWTEPERLFAAVGKYLFWHEKEGWEVFLNDTWHYACADCEPIPAEQYETVAGWFKRFGEAGVLYWVALQRGYDPEIPRYQNLVEMVRRQVAAPEPIL